MVPELGGDGGGGQLEDDEGGEGGGDEGGGGGGDETWPHGFSHREHIVHSIWSLEVAFGFGDGEDIVVVEAIITRSMIRLNWVL